MSIRSPEFPMIKWLALVGGGALLLGVGSVSAWERPFFRRETPEKYFTGTHLEIARAIVRRDLDKVKTLSEGLEIDKPFKKKLTLMWFAMIKKNYEAVTLLTRLGSDVDGQVVEGLGSPLDAALNSPTVDLLRAMLDGGLSPNHIHPSYNGMLARAIMSGNLEHLKLLRERGADVDQRDSIGRTALSQALAVVDTEKALYLIEQGADVNATMSNGVTIAWSLQNRIARQEAESPTAKKLEVVKRAMEQRGVKFPATSPAQVRQERNLDTDE